MFAAREAPLLLFAVAFAAAQVSEGDVTFAVRTSRDPANADFVQPVDASKIDPSGPVVFLVHGWTDGGNASWIRNLTDAYLERGGRSVVAVDWRAPAAKLYPVSARNAKEVGGLVGDAVLKISRERSVPLARFRLVGHSLGAHVAGAAGQRVKGAGGKVAWVTGLDPAGPLFEVPKVGKEDRLSDDDADVVEVVHTDGGILGFRNSLGTIDFYPNGGRFIQPNCDKKGDLFAEVKDLVGCSHHKSVEYYTYAVRKGGVSATQCKSYQLYQKGGCKGNKQAKFGAKQPPKEKGSYYVTIDR